MKIENIVEMFDEGYKLELITTPCYAGKVVETHLFKLDETAEIIKSIQKKYPEGIYLMDILPKVPLTSCDLWYMLNNDLVVSRYAYLRYAPI